MLETIREHFRGREHDFEHCAVAIWRLMAPNTGAIDVTRPSRDGGRDAVGTYSLGPTANRIALDFALEAKCYALTTSVGVRDVSRLISRIRHRNFGVLVTTSYFHRQVQEEVQKTDTPSPSFADATTSTPSASKDAPPPPQYSNGSHKASRPRSSSLGCHTEVQLAVADPAPGPFGPLPMPTHLDGPRSRAPKPGRGGHGPVWYGKLRQSHLRLPGTSVRSNPCLMV
ncbi:restriction endonuclease [Streptomyces scopuliridis]